MLLHQKPNLGEIDTGHTCFSALRAAQTVSPVKPLVTADNKPAAIAGPIIAVE